jgi:hypothetical protein
MNEAIKNHYERYLGPVSRDLAGCVSAQGNKYVLLVEGTNQHDAVLQAKHLLNYNNISHIDVLVEEGIKRYSKPNERDQPREGTFYILHRRVNLEQELARAKSEIDALQKSETMKNLPARKQFVESHLTLEYSKSIAYSGKSIAGKLVSHNPSDSVTVLKKQLKEILAKERQAQMLESENALFELWKRQYAGIDLCMLEHIGRYEDKSGSYFHILGERDMTDDIVKSMFRGMEPENIPTFMAMLCGYGKIRNLSTKDPTPDLFAGIKQKRIYDFVAGKEIK